MEPADAQLVRFYKFGPFLLDILKRTLYRDGERVQLKRKTFDLLVALLDNQGQVVSRDELLKSVWSDTFVTETNLSVHISTLRKALGERRDEHRYILTTSSKGYSFVDPVILLSQLDNAQQGASAPPHSPLSQLGSPSGSDDGYPEDPKKEFWRRPMFLAVFAIGLLALAVLVATRTLRNNGTTATPTQAREPALSALYPPADSREASVRPLTNDQWTNMFPVWMSSGDRVVFVSDRMHKTRMYDVWDVNHDGSDLRRRTEIPDSFSGLGLGILEVAPLGDERQLIVLEHVLFHEWFRFGLHNTRPIARKVKDGESPGFTSLMRIPGARGGHSFIVSANSKLAAWVIMTTPWFACPTRAEVRTMPLSSIDGSQFAETAGTLVLRSGFSCSVEPATPPFRRIGFSPDGSELVVSRNSTTERVAYDLEVYKVDGGFKTKLTDSGEKSFASNCNPAWSSDNRIAFSSNITGRTEIYTINPDRSGLRQITYNGGDWPSWSPDGSSIAFQSNRDGGTQIYVMAIKQP